MVRVIVCGGRDYGRTNIIGKVLSALDRHAVTVVTGGAAGADRLAADGWRDGGGRIEEFPANWREHGKAAGPIRNQQMLDFGADLVIAFPGGRGTADMVMRARKAGVSVLVVQP